MSIYNKSRISSFQCTISIIIYYIIIALYYVCTDTLRCIYSLISSRAYIIVVLSEWLVFLNAIKITFASKLQQRVSRGVPSFVGCGFFTWSPTSLQIISNFNQSLAHLSLICQQGIITRRYTIRFYTRFRQGRTPQSMVDITS